MKVYRTAQFIGDLISLCERTVGRGVPRPIELTILGSIVNALDDQAKVILNRQASLMNHWHRFGRARMVIPLWHPRLRPQRIPLESLFHFRPENRLVPLARSSLWTTGVQSTLTCDAYLFEGQIARFYFSSTSGDGVREVRGKSEWQVDTKIILDPMSRGHLTSDCKGKVLNVGDSDGLTMNAVLSADPLPSPLRLALSQFYAEKLPKDYLDLCEMAEGFSCGACQVLGLLELNRFITSKVDYYVLATVGVAGELIVLHNEPQTIRYLDYERLCPEDTKHSLFECILNTSQDEDYYRRALQ